MRAPCGTASSDFLKSNAWDFRPLKRCSTVLPAPRPAPAERHPSQFPASGVLGGTFRWYHLLGRQVKLFRFYRGHPDIALPFFGRAI